MPVFFRMSQAQPLLSTFPLLKQNEEFLCLKTGSKDNRSRAIRFKLVPGEINFPFLESLVVGLQFIVLRTKAVAMIWPEEKECCVSCLCDENTFLWASHLLFCPLWLLSHDWEACLSMQKRNSKGL